MVISLGHWAARSPSQLRDAPIGVDSLATVLWGGRPLADAQRSGRIAIEGDQAAAERFVRLFPTPEPAV